MRNQITQHLLTVLVVTSLISSAAFAQQPQQPSRQYQPVAPAVHVAPQNATNLDLQQARGQLAQQGVYPASATQRYRSNGTQNGTQPPAQPTAAQHAVHQQSAARQNQTGIYRRPEMVHQDSYVQQTSYVQEAGSQDEAVPQILAGNADNNARHASAQQDLATRAAQMRSAQPAGQFRPAPAMTPSTQPAMMPQIATPQLAQPRTTKLRAPAVAAQQMQSAATDRAELKRAQDAFVENMMQTVGQPPARTTPAQTSAVSTAARQMTMPQTATPQSTAPQSQAPPAATTQTTTAQPAMQADRLPTAIATPVNQVRQVSQQEVVPPTMPNPPVNTPVRTGQPSATMNSTSAAPTQIASESQIQLSAPAIEVRAIAPNTIGINKVSTFQIVVENKGSAEADKLIVGIDIPKWVDISNMNLTNGHKQITDGVEQARLIWTVDRIPAGGQQSISIDTIARKAEVFDLGIEWTFAPRKGLTNIQVTEPRLEMNISGPQEVMYGETATYHVAVRNPGTGTAENVNVMLPEALGGERAPLGYIPAGQERNFQVELLARTAGELILAANASGDAELSATAKREIMVRRGMLEISIEGPGMKYAGGVGQYTINIKNMGDAIATDVVAAIALPPGVTYLNGAESANEIDGGLKWPVGSLAAGDQRTYKINCQLDAAGNLQLEAGARANGDLAASSACLTMVETVADLVLTVADPKGPLPTGENVNYEIKVVNRGSKSAQDVKLVMQFSEGIEPNGANGLQHRLVPGQVLFAPITQIDPGEELTFQVVAQAQKEGTHVFRAQLTCNDSDSREIAEGTTRFFGDEVSIPVPQQQQQESTADNSDAVPSDTEINR